MDKHSSIKTNVSRLKQSIANSLVYQYLTYLSSMKQKDIRYEHKLDNLTLAYDKEFNSNITIESKVKWNYNHYQWRGVYSGSSDRIIFKDILENSILKGLTENHETVLISVIGGGFFLDLVEKFKFKRVILFDNNINEHVKINSLINNMLTYQKEFKIEDFENEIRSNANSFIPFLPNSKVSTKILYSSKISNDNNIIEDTFPISELSLDYPERKMPSSYISLNYILKKLKETLIKETFLEFPKIDLNNRLGIIFLSNIYRWDIRNKLIYESLKNYKGLIIIRENTSYALQSIENPNTHWRLNVLEHIGNEKTLHLINNIKILNDYKKNSLNLGTPVHLNSKINLDKYTTILIHQLFQNKRFHIFTRIMLLTKLSNIPNNVKKVIVTDLTNNLNKKNFRLLKKLLRDFNYQKEFFSRGEKNPRRNKIIVFERRH